MNSLQTLRKTHLWLGCFFAPMLLFFVISGWYQTMNPDRRKGPGEAEAIADRMRSVHAESLLPDPKVENYATKPFRYLVGTMSLSLILTVGLGIVLAFRLTRTTWTVWVALGLGLAVPLLLLWLGQKR